MRHQFKYAMVIIPVFLFAFCLSAMAEPSATSSNDLERNKKVVEHYFTDIIDKMGVGDSPRAEWEAMAMEVGKAFDDLFSEKSIQHFPGVPPSSPKGLLQVIRMGINQSMKTTIHQIIAEGNIVVARVSHDLTPKAEGFMGSPRIGCMVKVSGETIHWDALAMFRLADGKIVEEWISRDDLGVLLQTGKIAFEPCGPLPAK